jgi:hypothetical protein
MSPTALATRPRTRARAAPDPLIRYPVFKAYAPGRHRPLLVEHVMPLIEDYLGRGYILTGRQVLYALVSRALVTNVFASYRSIMTMLKKARRGGYLSFAAFEDRSRSTYAPLEFRDLRHRLESARDTHVLERWRDQPAYIEIGTEKDALVGFLRPLADDLHVRVSSTRGNDSDVHLNEMAMRFREARDQGHVGYLILATDHDPTGWDMERDVRKRLAMFGAGEDVVTIVRIALTLEQVRQHTLPENPLKLKDTEGGETYSDTRAKAYIAATGQTTSWELDALPPETLIALYREAVLSHRDEAAYARVLRREDKDRAYFTRVIRALPPPPTQTRRRR